MPTLPDAPEILNREFLQVRARLLEIASALDRIDRAAGTADGDPRLAQIHQALEVVGEHEGDRAERIQMLFSLPYQADWKSTFALSRDT